MLAIWQGSDNSSNVVLTLTNRHKSNNNYFSVFDSVFQWKENVHCFIPLELSLELDFFIWEGTTDRAVFVEDVVRERTEPRRGGENLF